MRGGGEDGGDGEESEEGDGGKWRGEPTVATAGVFFFSLFEFEMRACVLFVDDDD
jgi:hypothetical protein